MRHAGRRGRVVLLRPDVSAQRLQRPTCSRRSGAPATSRHLARRHLHRRLRRPHPRTERALVLVDGIVGARALPGPQRVLGAEIQKAGGLRMPGKRPKPRTDDEIDRKLWPWLAAVRWTRSPTGALPPLYLGYGLGRPLRATQPSSCWPTCCPTAMCSRPRAAMTGRSGRQPLAQPARRAASPVEQPRTSAAHAVSGRGDDSDAMGHRGLTSNA
jgi:hypothetical protein